MHGSTQTDILNAIDARIAGLSSCRAYLTDGTCPLQLGATDVQRQAPHPNGRRRQVNGTRPKARNATAKGKTATRRKAQARTKPAPKPEPTAPATPAQVARPQKAAPAKVDAGAEHVLHVLAQLKGATVHQLADALEIKYAQAWWRLQPLLEQKRVEKDGSGKYHVKPATA